MNGEVMNKSVRISEAAKILGVSENTVRQWCKENRLRYRTTSGNHRLFNLADLYDFNKRRENNPSRYRKHTVKGNSSLTPTSHIEWLSSAECSLKAQEYMATNQKCVVTVFSAILYDDVSNPIFITDPYQRLEWNNFDTDKNITNFVYTHLGENCKDLVGKKVALVIEGNKSYGCYIVWGETSSSYPSPHILLTQKKELNKMTGKSLIKYSEYEVIAPFFMTYGPEYFRNDTPNYGFRIGWGNDHQNEGRITLDTDALTEGLLTSCVLNMDPIVMSENDKDSIERIFKFYNLASHLLKLSTLSINCIPYPISLHVAHDGKRQEVELEKVPGFVAIGKKEDIRVEVDDTRKVAIDRWYDGLVENESLPSLPIWIPSASSISVSWSWPNIHIPDYLSTIQNRISISGLASFKMLMRTTIPTMYLPENSDD